MIQFQNVCWRLQCLMNVKLVTVEYRMAAVCFCVFPDALGPVYCSEELNLEF